MGTQKGIQMKIIIYSIFFMLLGNTIIAGTACFDEKTKTSLSLVFSEEEQIIYVTLSNLGDKPVKFMDGIFSRNKYQQTARHIFSYFINSDGSYTGKNVKNIPEYKDGYSSMLIPGIALSSEDSTIAINPNEALTRSFKLKDILAKFDAAFGGEKKTRKTYVINVIIPLLSSEKSYPGTTGPRGISGRLKCTLEIPVEKLKN